MLVQDLAIAVQRYERFHLALRPPLGIAHFIVMEAIQYKKTHAQAKISERTGLPQERVRRIIHRLVNRGYVRRTSKPAPNQGRPIEITEAGAAAWHKTKKAIERAEADTLSGITTKEDRQTFLNLLSSVATIQKS